MAMNGIERIKEAVRPLERALTRHQLYALLDEVADIRVFMEHHVYAVWDFMSLLKALQNRLTCTTLPWKPDFNPRTARFINEIVLGEETDVDRNGVPASHFMLYLESMDEVGADRRPIQELLSRVSGMHDVREKIAASDLAPGIRSFLDFTFALIEEGKTHKIAAAFTFGRESLIPELFIEILNRPNQHKDQYPRLLYYLERHIEVDGDEHGPLSEAMIAELCGDDARRWEEAGEVAAEALRRRIAMWDEIAGALLPAPSA